MSTCMHVSKQVQCLTRSRDTSLIQHKAAQQTRRSPGQGQSQSDASTQQQAERLNAHAHAHAHAHATRQVLCGMSSATARLVYTTKFNRASNLLGYAGEAHTHRPAISQYACTNRSCKLATCPACWICITVYCSSQSVCIKAACLRFTRPSSLQSSDQRWLARRLLHQAIGLLLCLLTR